MTARISISLADADFHLPSSRNRNGADLSAPTPQNTPLNNAPLTREALSRPTVGTIGEEKEEEGNGESHL